MRSHLPLFWFWYQVLCMLGKCFTTELYPWSWRASLWWKARHIACLCWGSTHPHVESRPGRFSHASCLICVDTKPQFQRLPLWYLVSLLWRCTCWASSSWDRQQEFGSMPLLDCSVPTEQGGSLAIELCLHFLSVWDGIPLQRSSCISLLKFWGYRCALPTWLRTEDCIRPEPRTVSQMCIILIGHLRSLHPSILSLINRNNKIPVSGGHCEGCMNDLMNYLV